MIIGFRLLEEDEQSLDKCQRRVRGNRKKSSYNQGKRRLGDVESHLQRGNIRATLFRLLCTGFSTRPRLVELPS